VFPISILTSQQDNALLSKAMNGNNAKTPYLPFGTDYRRLTPEQRRAEIADYVAAKTSSQIRLRDNANRTGLTTANYNIHPILIHEVELRKMGGQRINTTSTSRNPVQDPRFRPATTDIYGLPRNRGFGASGEFRNN